MDDDTLPVIDLAEDEPADGDVLGADHALSRPLRRPRARGQGQGRRAGLVAAMLAVATVGVAGGVAWSSAARRVAIDVAPRAGEFADRLGCVDGHPRVRNDLGLWDDTAPLSSGRSLPMPPWLRDRSLSATKIRAAADAARWSNTNTEAAVAFGTFTLAEWDAATRSQLQRADGWARAWWSRHGDEAPLTWTEGTVLTAVRDAVLDDRRLTEQAARSLRGSLTWSVLPPASGRERADTAVIGGTDRSDSRLVEVLVYRRGADGYLRLRGRAHCDEVDHPAGSPFTRGDFSPQPLAPALACDSRPLLRPEPGSRVHTGAMELPPPIDMPVTSPPHAPGSYSVPDGHTPPRELPRSQSDGPALSPEVALERWTASDQRRRDTVGGNLSYALVATGNTAAYAVGTHDGRVKLVIELRRQLGGGWDTANHSGCHADLVQSA